MEEYLAPDFHRLTPNDEISARMSGFQETLKTQGLDAVLIVYPVDLFYYSGTMQVGHLIVPAHGDPLLLIRRNLARAKTESSLTDVRDLSSFRDLPALIRKHLDMEPNRLGLELDVLPVNMFQRYQSLWPDVSFEDVSPLIMAQRAVKSEYEIDRMREAGALARRVYGAVPDLLEAGRSEIEVAGLMTKVAYDGGHQNYLRMRSFDGINYTWHVISGESGVVPSSLDASFAGYGLSPAFPAGASRKIINQGEPILIDFGLCLDGYQVDLTRMFSIGPPPRQALDAYQALCRIESELMDNLVPGGTGEELFNLAVARAEQLGFGHAFLGPAHRKVSFAGHGVGLEINELPVLAPGFTQPIEAGMTVALELKMVFPGMGAVGLENTVRVKNHGLEKLTPANEDFVVV